MRLRPMLYATAFAAVACGPMPGKGELESYATSTEPIINGHECAVDEQPATVAIILDTTLSANGQSGRLKTVICTGTVIAPDVVVAAAHCVDPAIIGSGFLTLSNTRFFVTFEKDLAAMAESSARGPNGDYPLPADAIEATRWVEHPQFGFPDMAPPGPGNYHDASVFFLSKTVTVKPEVVITAAETAQIKAGRPVDIGGWGQQTITSGSEPPPPGTLGKKRCATTELGVVGQWEMQVGTDGTNPNKCHGDSGGPTYMQVEAASLNKRRLVGITSHSFDDSDCAVGGVDTRVDVMRDWLDAEMKKACADHTRVWCDFDGVVPPEFWEPVPVPVKEDPGSAGDAPPKKGCLGCSTADLASSLALLGLFMRRRR